MHRKKEMTLLSALGLTMWASVIWGTSSKSDAMKCLWRDNPLSENFRITFSAQERVCKEHTLDWYHNHWQNCLKLTWKHSLYLNWIYLINFACRKKHFIIVKKTIFYSVRIYIYLLEVAFQIPFTFLARRSSRNNSSSIKYSMSESLE